MKKFAHEYKDCGRNLYARITAKVYSFIFCRMGIESATNQFDLRMINFDNNFTTATYTVIGKYDDLMDYVSMKSVKSFTILGVDVIGRQLEIDFPKPLDDWKSIRKEMSSCRMYDPRTDY